LTDSEDDIAAAQRGLEFFYGWFTDPVVFGDYPEVMRQRLGDRLPQFSEEQKEMMKNSADFLGLNHYTTHYASAQPVEENEAENGNGGMVDDQEVYLSTNPDWTVTGNGWLVVPWGLRKMLNWIDKRYGHLPVYITENGTVAPGLADDEQCRDDFRADFIEAYTNDMKKAMKDGVDVRGYFCWSMLDNFEWAFGYSMRFGIVHVNFETLERTPKNSFYRYQDIIKKNMGEI